MKKICICGHFGNNMEFNDGQTVKTQNIYAALKEHYGEEEIYRIDTYNWKRRPIKLLKECIKGMKMCKNILILPAHNGVKVFIPMFFFLNKLYKRKIFYIVIGGWLPEFLKNKKYLTKKMKMLNKIFVETNKMKKDLDKLEIENTEILVNFKDLKPIPIENMKIDFAEPYKLCTFSRVMEEKGIEDAINVVKQINEENGKTIYKLDIYGPVDIGYKEKFENMIKDFPEYINYKGCVDYSKAVETINQYYLLLFPTRFKTEGIPGTIIDALAAGVPSIVSEWNNVYEIIENGRTGYIYKFGDIEDFKEKLLNISKEEVINMKKKCVLIAENYKPYNAIKVLLNEL